MFTLRRQMQRNVVAASRRQFGADAHHGSNPSRMEYDEWKTLINKLHNPATAEAEKAQIAARFKEARLQDTDVSKFHQRLRIQTMSEAEFQAFRADLKSSPYATSHPLMTKYNEAVALADRANKPRPDMFQYELKAPKTFTKEELGNGTIAQKRMNEYIYRMQTDPKTDNKWYGGMSLDTLDVSRYEKQSLIYLAAAAIFATYGANLYRNLYMEKYSTLDMANWEVRVITARAFKERGW